jgi:peptidoglycan/LPS O-acetylase OafA/YrhL
VTYRGLDTFRLFAFLAVFLFHVDLMPVGYLGVLAFFVLSGFLITPILVDMRRGLGTRQFFVNFYGRRCLRIFPLYYAYLAVMVAGAGVALAVDGLPRAIEQLSSQLGYALTYSYDFFHASSAFQQSPLLTHFWSLAVEEQFYLAWPLVVFCVPHRRLRAVLIAMIVAGPIFRLAEAGVVASSFGGLLYPRTDLTIYVLPFSHIDAFAIGGYLALYGRTPSSASVALYSALLVGAGMVSGRLATGSMGFGVGYGPFMADSWKWVWAYTGFNALFGWLLLMIRDRGFLRPVMEHPALCYLGRISYGLYVYHFAVIWAVSLVVEALFPQSLLVGRAVLVITSLILTIAISAVSYTVLEAPFLRLKDKYFARERARTLAPIPVPAVLSEGPYQTT